MHELGIRSGADLRAQPLDFLVERFGKAGRLYHQFAQGIDLRPVCPTRVRKSVGCESTFESDRVTLGEMSEELYALSARLRRRLERAAFRGHTLTLKVKFADFRQITRSLSPGEKLSASSGLFPLAERLLRESGVPGRPVRLLGLSVSNPAQDLPPEQHELYRQLRFRTRRILRAGFPFGIGPLAERVLLVRSLSFPVGRSVAGKVFRALSRSVAAVSRPFTAFGRSVRPEDFRLFQPSAIQSRLPCSVAVVSVHRPARM